MKRMGKRILAWVMALCLTAGLLPIMEWSAKATEPTWQDIAERPAEGFGSDDSPFIIHNGAELAWVLGESNHAVLANNIDLTGRVWDAPERYKGHLNGNGHFISGVNSETGGLLESLASYSGSYNVNVAESGVVENLTLYVSNSGPYAGALAFSINGLVRNCAVFGEAEVYYDANATPVDGTGNRYQGAFAAQVYGKLENCASFVNWTVYCPERDSAQMTVGGLAGEHTGEMVNCFNYGDITFLPEEDGVEYGASAGGLAGYMTGSAKITGCTNYGEITDATQWCGGIVGYANSNTWSSDGAATIANCVNKAVLSAEECEEMGGIAGRLYEADGVKNCQNYGTVTNGGDSSNTGGIVGGIYYAGSIVNCTNGGAVTGGNYTGGIVGEVYRSSDSDTVEVKDCVNLASVTAVETARNPMVGGIAGSNMGTIQFCENVGAVSSHGSAAGIVGIQSSYNATVIPVVEECVNFGNVESTDEWGWAAGIVYSNTAGVIRGCRNSGTVTAAYAAGIASLNCSMVMNEETAYYGTVTGCTSAGEVRASYIGAGLVNTNSGIVTASRCVAMVEATDADAYGMAGLVYQNEYDNYGDRMDYGTVSDCCFHGTFRAPEGADVWVGTLVAGASAGGWVENCYAVSVLEVPGLREYRLSAVQAGEIYDEETDEYLGEVKTSENCYSTMGARWGEQAAILTASEMQTAEFVTALDTEGGTVAARGVWKAGSPYPELTGEADVITNTGNQTMMNSAANHYENYFDVLAERTVRVFLEGSQYGDSFTVTANLPDGTKVNSLWDTTCALLELELGKDAGEVTFSCEGYHPLTMPVELLGSYNHVRLWKTREGTNYPYLETALLDRTATNYRSMQNLLVDGETIYSTLQVPEDLYVSVDWGSGAPGSITLTADGEDVLPLQEGWNKNLVLAKMLSTGCDVGIRVKGERSVHYPLQLKVAEGDVPELEIELGDMITEVMPEDVDAIAGQTLTLDLGDLSGGAIPIEMEVCGNQLRMILGIRLENAEYFAAAYDTVSNALWMYNQPPTFQSVSKKLEKLYEYSFPTEKYGSVGTKAALNVVGYATFEIEGSDVTFVDGKLGVLAKGETQFVQHMVVTTPVGPIPWYVENGLVAELFPYGGMKHDPEEKKLTFGAGMNSSLELYVGPGLGHKELLSGGVRGGGNIKVESAIPIQHDDTALYLNAKGYLVGTLCGMEFKADIWNSNDVVLYKNGVWFPDGTGTASLMMAEDMGYSWPDQSYLAGQAFVGNEMPPTLFAVEDALVDAKTFVESAYLYNGVQQAAFADGTRLMVWVGGDATRPLAANRPALYYSFFDGTSWSEAAQVETDGTADFDPVLRCVEDTALLVWQDADAPAQTDDITDVTAKDRAAGVGISFASFDKAEKSFVGVTSVTGSTDGKTDFSPDVTLVDGEAAVVWLRKTGDDPLGEETALMAAQSVSGSWGAARMLVSNAATADEPAAVEEDGVLAVYFSQDADGDLMTPDDRELYCVKAGATERVTNNAVTDSRVSVADGQVVWYQDGGVRIGTETVVLDTYGDDYQYLPGTRGTDAILYTETDEEGNTVLYAVFDDGSGWGKRVAVTESTDYLHSYHGVFLPDGVLSVAVNSWDESGETPAATILTYDLLPCCDIAVAAADYVPHSLVAGNELELDVTVRNNGAANVASVRLDVYNGETLLATDYLTEALPSGHEAVHTVRCTPGETLPASVTVKATAIGGADANRADNDFVCAFARQDLSVEYVTAENSRETTEVSVYLANRGSEEIASAILTLKDMDGNRLAQQKVMYLEGRGAQNIHFSLTEPLPEGAVLCAEASPLAEENLRNNNTAFCTVQTVQASEPEEDKGSVSFTADTAKTASGISVTITAENTMPVAQTVTFVAAAYRDGKQVAVELWENAALKAGESVSRNLMLNTTAADAVKVFALDANRTPLLKHRENFLT